ncbi:serine hydrolase domain-containing protein [Flavobacterium hydatis]|uniref:Beta-lactamase-related domain-containing protein n=1 Tax=Flavobacterium hydatis TaxID=991 RepID=A0A086AAQ7_FLAHY|nr:serine hydrolase domain-containing protein [Flavobacterium hydatis]KFF13771.1 hypothetical protein IW20_16965 [Flavobacterium hydatis]OXA92445.1 hypothetical protein B0A62_15575 [Flavobacterium hydatis]
MKAKLKDKIPVLLMIFLLVNLGFSQSKTNDLKTDNPLKTRLDSVVHKKVLSYYEDNRAVGLSMVILQNGKKHYYNYGETQFGSGILPTKKTIYELGSITKTFTGILLAQAVLDKKINLDDDIRKYLPGEFPNLEYKGTPIRVVDLSNHTGRITRVFKNLWQREAYDSLNPYTSYTKKLLYEGLHEMKLDSLVGKTSSYSNMGVGLLGVILEDVYKVPYFNLVNKYVLSPLKMNNTITDNNVSSVPSRDLAMPHNAKKQVTPRWDSGELFAIGSLESNTEDMIKYVVGNISNATPAIALSHKLTYGSLNEGMGLNWYIHKTNKGSLLFGHNGGAGGSRSTLQFFPELNSGFVLLTNSLANRNILEKEISELLDDKK